MVMNKSEHNHYHGYQDQKDAFNEKLNDLSSQILTDLWSNSASVSEIIAYSLAESMDYVAIVKYCHVNNSVTVLGAVTLELIERHLSEMADELAEEELT